MYAQADYNDSNMMYWIHCIPKALDTKQEKYKENSQNFKFLD